MASVTSHRSWSIPVSTQSDSAVFPHENLCQPSSLQSKLRSIRTRLNWLQTVIDGQKSQRNPTDLDWTRASCTRWSGSSQLPSDKTLSKKACAAELHCKPTRRVDQLCEMCPRTRLNCRGPTTNKPTNQHQPPRTTTNPPAYEHQPNRPANL